ncbi:MAG: beta-lactamase hydrolase domain-containing protein [Pseudomonadota bacterium]
MTAPVRFDPHGWAAGQPDAAQLAELAGQGVRTVINLRAPGEAVDFDEPAQVARLGMRYVAFPVTGAADLDAGRVRGFGATLDEARRQGGVLVHCASSNRVGAMIALDEALNRGRPLDAALERGRAAGLATLEAAVIALVASERPDA